MDTGSEDGPAEWGTTRIRSAAQRRWMTQEVLRLQAIGALLPCRKADLKYCSSIFLVDKPGPKQFRMVVNMKPVNWKWWEQEYSYKMEGLKGFLGMAWIGAWAVS
jgi:hypothetical protein